MKKIIWLIAALLQTGCGAATANDFYNATGAPSEGSGLSSATMRAEFAAIEDGFDVISPLTGHGSEFVTINAGETAQESVLASAVAGLIGAQETSEKDASGGYAGLTLYKINMGNVAGTFTSFLTNTNTAARTYTFQDANGTVEHTGHTVASHGDTTATGAELETLTNGSSADSLHNHTTGNLSDTTATGANLNTLTDTSDADGLHSHTYANLTDATVTQADMTTLTDGSDAGSLHYHSIDAGANLLINAGFRVNQEVYVDGTDFTSVGEYGYDMWMSTNTTASNGVSVSGKTITLEANASLEQINDDLIYHAGETVTISLDSGTVNVSGGGITGTQALNSTTSYTFTLGVTTTDGIVISYSSPGAFSGLRLMFGSVSSTAVERGISEEELLCYRYFYRVTTALGTIVGRAAKIATGYTGTTSANIFMVLPVPMRLFDPTVTFVDHGTGNQIYLVHNGSSVPMLVTDTVVSSVETTGNIIEFKVGGFVGLTANHPAILFLYGNIGQLVSLNIDARY